MAAAAACRSCKDALRRLRFNEKARIDVLRSGHGHRPVNTDAVNSPMSREELHRVQMHHFHMEYNAVKTDFELFQATIRSDLESRNGTVKFVLSLHALTIAMLVGFSKVSEMDVLPRLPSGSTGVEYMLSPHTFCEWIDD